MVTRPRILGIPIADIDTASSRIRLFSLFDAIGDKAAFHTLQPGDYETLGSTDHHRYDLIYVQKDAHRAVVEFCERARDARKPIIYDIDDDFGCWPGMHEPDLCRLATCVTVDSLGRGHEVAEISNKTVVIPCMIDQAQDSARKVGPTYEGTIGTVGTYGNLSSLLGTRPYMERVPNTIRQFAVGPSNANERSVGIPLRAFRRTSFISDIKRADLFVLAHQNGHAGRKDNNRLVLAMSLGIPALVSHTEAYIETMIEVGRPDLVCMPSDIPERIDMLSDPTLRATLGRQFMEFAWQRYSPARCAEIFLNTVFEALEDA